MRPAPQPAHPPAFRGLEFSLFGIPVLVRPAFLLVTIVFGSMGGDVSRAAIWVGIVFVSVLIHELGHALAMRGFGFSPAIELHAMGGFTAWSQQKVPSAGQRLLVTACGPGAGLMLGGLATVGLGLLEPGTNPLLGWTVKQAQWVNIGWSVINLMPVLPWDGGLILDSAVEVIGRRARPKVAAVVSVLIGGAVALFGLRNSQIMLVYFGGVGVWQGYSRLRPKKPADDGLLEHVWALMQAQRFAEAEQLAQQRALLTVEASERAKLYEAIAWSRLLREDWRGADQAIERMGGVKPSRHLAATLAAHQGRHEEVISLLTPPPASTSELALRTDSLISLGRFEAVVTDACDLLAKSDLQQRRSAQLLAARLFEAGAFEPSLQVSLSAFGAIGDPVDLVNAACAQARLGQLREGLATLQRAIGAGFADRRHLLEDPDLAPLRELPGWEAALRAAGRSG